MSELLISMNEKLVEFSSDINAIPKAFSGGKGGEQGTKP